METKKIAELAKILRQNRLTKLDLTEGGNRLILEAAIGGSVPAEVPSPVFEEEPESFHETVEMPVQAEPLFSGVEQKSPLVGTVYLAPQSGAEPFVKTGSRIQAGDVLCIVESMKMFNNIEAEMDGTIEAVLVDNGQIVEFGQPLFRIHPA